CAAIIVPGMFDRQPGYFLSNSPKMYTISSLDEVRKSCFLLVSHPRKGQKYINQVFLSDSHPEYCVSGAVRAHLGKVAPYPYSIQVIPV
ncbi:hypothetical protein, partial [Eubacterium pyruvativorans]|uniref:hypothetical protein n=1 Tax=Eubacterium pyruvativorans TaxID=155865 RepID=UPI0023EFE20E